MKFIIEHLEEKIYPWCLYEYEHLSHFVGREKVLFTKIASKDDLVKIKRYGKATSESVLGIPLEKPCLLDPKAKKTLTSGDNFTTFIFGGILGDHPERGRTEKYLTSKLKNVKTRNLGKKQMSTDTAVIVTKLIADGKEFKDLYFKDDPVIELKKGRVREEIILPYRYLILNKKIVISEKLLNYLKMKKSL